jgi:hypothetical protein
VTDNNSDRYGEDYPRTELFPPSISDNSSESISFEEQLAQQSKKPDDTATTPIDLEDLVSRFNQHIPTEELPVENAETRTVADAIKLAFRELRPAIMEMLLEVQRVRDFQHESEKEPDIEYIRRLHGFKVVIQLASPALLFAILTACFVLAAGNFLASFVGVLVVGTAIAWGARFVSQLTTREYEEGVVRFSRWARLGFVAGALVLCAAFVLTLEQFGVNTYWSAAYVAISLGILYFSLRLLYMWSHLYIVRDGGVLRAQRPEKGVFFLPTLSRELYLNNVNDCNYAQTWIEEKLGMYRILIRLDADMPDPSNGPEEKEAYRNAKFWTNLKFVVDGRQLRDAIKQGSFQRKG